MTRIFRYRDRSDDFLLLHHGNEISGWLLTEQVKSLSLSLSPVQMYLKKMERITYRVPGCVYILSSDISASLLLSLLYVPWLFCSNRSLMSNLETLAKNKHIAGLSNEVENVIKMSLTITVAVYEEVAKCYSEYRAMSI